MTGPIREGRQKTDLLLWLEQNDPEKLKRASWRKLAEESSIVDLGGLFELQPEAKR